MAYGLKKNSQNNLKKKKKPVLISYNRCGPCLYIYVYTMHTCFHNGKYVYGLMTHAFDHINQSVHPSVHSCAYQINISVFTLVIVLVSLFL